jgi:type III secretion system regulator LcrR
MLKADSFTQWLRHRGMAPEPYAPAAYLGMPAVGWQIPVGHSVFVYRVPDDASRSLIIVLFERQGERSGLGSPFVDIVRFISLVKRSEAPIDTIEGRVEALQGRPQDSLEGERIAAFYQRYLAAYRTFVRDGLQWFAGDLRKYVPPLRAERNWLSTEVEALA